MLAHGRPDPRSVAELVERDGARQHEVLALLHQTMGNAFVREVVAALAPGPAVQRKSGGPGPTTADPAGTANAGVQSANDRLPHHDQIQASFGKHDISTIRSQTGGNAAEASRKLGASAYAVGDRVGFAQSPDLHTAAHEAAHVVQQQAGVQLKGGIDGGKDDPYEQHADAVADKVVRGESSEALLDQMGPAKRRGASRSNTVQRKSVTPSGMVNARHYLSFNATDARNAITNHLVQQRLPAPHPRLQWRDEKAFYEQLFRGFNTFDISFEHPYDFAQALFPGDPYGLVDQMRPIAKAAPEEESKEDAMAGGPVGPWQWSPGIGTALAQLVEQAVIQSLYRLGPRWIEIAELAGPASGTVFVDPTAIRRSHPMDRYVLPALCLPKVIDLLKDPASAKKKPAKPDTKIGIQPVELEWLGAGVNGRKELWNWVRAKPATATAEDVAAKLFDYMTAQDHEKHAEYYAAFLTAAPPLFGIPPQWAKTFEETREFRPPPDKIAASDTDPDHQITQLGGSKASDDQALLEASPGATKASAPEPGATHDELIADVRSQATFLKAKLGSWHLGGEADKALAFIARRQDDHADAAKWVPALRAQRDNLSTIATGILQLDAAADQMKLKSKTGDEARPLREIMRFYGDAVATAHMTETSKRMIMRAANAQSALTLQGLQSSIHDMDMSADMMRGAVSNNDYDRNKESNNVSHLDDEGLTLQTRIMRGNAVSADEIEDYQIRAEEASLDAKMIATEYALAELAHSADEAGAGLAAWFAALPSSKFRHLGEATDAIRAKMSDIRFHWNSAKDRSDMPSDEQVEAGLEEKDYTRRNRRKAVQDAKQAFAKMSKDENISDFLRSGANTVKWQNFRTACVKVAALIGVSLVGGFVGGMIARGAASLMMGAGGATAVEGLSLGGTIVARGLGMATETVVTSAGQTAIFGGGYGANFLENMIMNLGTAGVMKVIGEGAADAMKVEKAVGGMWSKAAYGGKVVLAESATISAHLIMGVAMGYVAHKIVTGESQPPPATVEDWMLQGASIAVGRYVGHAIAGRQHEHGRLKGLGVAGADKLIMDSEALLALAKHAEQHPEAKNAMELLGKRHALLTEEMKVLEELEKSPAKMKAAKLSAKDITRSKSDLRAQLAESHSEGFAQVALHTSGMHELIPGALWSGTEPEVTALVKNARDAGLNASAVQDPHGGSWHVKVGDHEIVVEERAAKTKTVGIENRGEPYVDPRTGRDGEPEYPHAHLDRRELRPFKKMNARQSWDAVEKAFKAKEKSVALGTKIKTPEAGHALLQRLAVGDASVLAELGVTGAPHDLDTSTREWALVEGRDGYAIYAGLYDSVGLPADVRVIGHNHPGPVTEGANAGKIKDLPTDAHGMAYKDVLADPTVARKAGIVPSTADIHAISDGGEHTIYTRYIHVGGGKVANPGANGARVSIHLTDTKVVLINKRTSQYYYETQMQVKDSTGAVLWSGPIYTDWSAFAPGGRVMFERPPILDRPPTGWAKP